MQKAQHGNIVSNTAKSPICISMVLIVSPSTNGGVEYTAKRRVVVRCIVVLCEPYLHFHGLAL